jgi:hypothetical protein
LFKTDKQLNQDWVPQFSKEQLDGDSPSIPQVAPDLFSTEMAKIGEFCMDNLDIKLLSILLLGRVFQLAVYLTYGI